MVTSGSLKIKSLVAILEEAENQGFSGTVTLKGKTGLASISLKAPFVRNDGAATANCP